MKHLMSWKLIAILFAMGLASPISDVKAKTNTNYESMDIRLRLKPRPPQQIAAFYEARGFNKAMLKIISQYCFITVLIKNKSNHVIVHDLTGWRFTHADKDIPRLTRQALLKTWRDMAIPPAHQSTFRWTLLPEQLDFQPNEAEGGNIVLPASTSPFSISARFRILDNKPGHRITVRFDNIQCAQNLK